MTIQKKIVYLPIETRSREFDSKCLVALGCIEKGMAVVLSSAGASKINLPGVALLKSAASFEKEHIAKLKEQHIKCAVIDEEGFVQTKNEKQRALRYSQETIDLVDQVFFNGEAEKELLNRFYSIPENKGTVSGNARFDFYKPEFHSYYQEQAKAHQLKHGKYILITSRFGNITPARKTGYIDFLKNARGIKEKDDLDIFRDFFTHSKKIYQSFFDLLPQLSQKFSDFQIVIRPHPSEAPDFWQSAADKLHNVVVDSEGPIGPWVLGADAVLHNGCTTGLEAFLMRRPVFSYMPFTSEEFDLKLPNYVSMQCYDEDSLLASMGEHLFAKPAQSDAEKQLELSKVEYAKHYLNNADDTQAYVNIADGLASLALRQEAYDLRRIKHRLPTIIKNKLRKLRTYIAIYLFKFGIPMPNVFKEGYYAFQKNPGINESDTKINMAKLAAVTAINTQGLVIKKVDEDVLLIYKNI